MRKISYIFRISLLLALAASYGRALEQPPVCTAAALAALKPIPQPLFACEGSSQLCSSDQPLGEDDPHCKSATKEYEKKLAGVLTARWWGESASTLEACRVHGKPGPLTKDESDSLNQGYGAQVQGTDRVRMLVVGDACEAAGMSNEFLIVRTSKGIAMTVLYYDFNQGGQEAPFGLDVVNNDSATFALFTTQGHDMQTAYTSTTAYKIDATGYAAPCPLFVAETGASTRLDQSQPVVGDVHLTDTAIVRNGKFVKQFNSYKDNSCGQDDPKCKPVTAQRYTWNGNAFVVSDYQTRRRDFLHKLAIQRDCVKKKFDPKKGTADCAVQSSCENYNDLAWLNLMAHNFINARHDAEMALDSCRGNPAKYKAARYNYRHSQQGLKTR